MKIYGMILKNEIEDEQFQKLLYLVDDNKRNRVLKYHFRRDAQNTLLADILTRYLISKTYSIPFFDIQFEYNEYGKPLLKNDNTIYFNVSHSKDFIVSAVHNHSIGIDVEYINAMDLGIADRFFTKEENEYVKENKEFEKKRFYEIWTLKESFLKAIGTGLHTSLSSFNVYSPDHTLTFHEVSYFFKNVSFMGYELSVCTPAKIDEMQIDMLEIKELIEALPYR